MTNNSEQRKHELLQLLQRVEQIRPEETESKRQEDGELIALARQGDRIAFNQLLQRYQDHVYTYVVHLGSDKQKAVAITCDVFIKAYRKLRRFQGDISFKAWLLNIAEQQVHKASVKWYLAVLPFSLYQWYQRIVETQETAEDIPVSQESEGEHVRGPLSAYLDDELDEADMLQVEAHLAECEECGLAFESLLHTSDMVSHFGMLNAPANVRVAVNDALDKGSVWEEWFTHPGYRPFPQFAAIAATLCVIVLGTFFVTQQVQIDRQMRRLQAANARLRKVRNATFSRQETTFNTFVIVTGTLVSEGLSPEAVEYVSALFPQVQSDTAPEPRFIPGSLATLGDDLIQYLQAHHGTIQDDQSYPDPPLNVRHIIATFPRYSSTLAHFLDQLEQENPGQSEETSLFEPGTITLEIHILDRQS